MFTKEQLCAVEWWRPITEHPLYEISSHGRVRSWMYRGGRRLKKSRLLKCCPNTNGYPQVRLYNGPDGDFQVTVHRLVLKAFSPEREFDGAEINHIDCNKFNNRWDNLEWCDRTHNVRHAFDNGRLGRGENRHNTKITWKISSEIQERIKRGQPNASIARDFGLSARLIFTIKSGQHWSSDLSKAPLIN